MKTKGEKVTYQWLSCNHRNFHCTRFPIFRWTEPCCSTYDEQTDRVELTTALGNLRCLIYTDPYYGARNQWLTNAGFPMTLLNWTSRCVKISKNTQQHSPKKKKYMRCTLYSSFWMGRCYFFFNYRLGLKLIIIWKTHWFQLWLIWNGGFIDYWWFIKLVAEAPNWVTMHSTSVP